MCALPAPGTCCQRIESREIESCSRKANGRFLWMRAIQEQGVAQDLRDLAAGLASQLSRGTLAIDLGVLPDADLDQFVIQERLFDRLDERRGETFFADLQDRREVMSFAAQEAALFSGKTHDRWELNTNPWGR